MSKLIKTYTVLFLCLIFGSLSKAESLSNVYKKETLEILNFLDESGVQKVGCRDGGRTCVSPRELADLINDHKIDFTETADFKKGLSSTRRHAFYDSQKAKIFLNTRVVHPPEAIGALGLHEVIGAAGFAEPEYKYSIMASVLKEMNQGEHTSDYPQLSQKALSQLFSWTDENLNKETPISHDNANLKAEGGDFVGGGGDPLALQQRVLFIRYMLKSSSLSKTKTQPWLPFRLSIPIEISDEASQVHFIMKKWKENKWPDHIVVPKYLLSTPPEHDALAPNRALEEIASYFSQLSGGLIFNQLYKNKDKEKK